MVKTHPVLTASAIMLSGLAAPCASAQDFLPYPPECQSMLSSYQCQGDYAWGVEQLAYHGSDSVIDGIVWKRIERSYWLEAWGSPPGGDFNDLLGFMRCDTAGRSWYKYGADGPPMILFDPSLAIGEAVPPENWLIGGAVLSSVDTVIDNQGIARRHYHLSGITFIEGVGFSGNSPFIVCGAGTLSHMLCHIMDSLHVIGMAQYCEPLVDAVAEAFSPPQRIRVVPNPVIDEFTLMDAGRDAVLCVVTDLFGRPVMAKPLAQDSRMDARGLVPGLFVLRLYDSSGRPMASARFIKE